MLDKHETMKVSCIPSTFITEIISSNVGCTPAFLLYPLQGINHLNMNAQKSGDFCNV